MKTIKTARMVYVGLAIILLWAGMAVGDDSMIVDSVGNVGIGTADITSKLTVNGSIKIINGGAFAFADNGQISSLDNNHRILFRRSSNIIELREYGDIVFSAGATSGAATNTMIVDNLGRVGIGVGYATPLSKLHIKHTTASSGDDMVAGGIRLENSALNTWANICIAQYGLNFLQLRLNNGVYLLLREDGVTATNKFQTDSVGIGTAPGGSIQILGTTIPLALDVNGYVRCTGTFETSDARFKEDIQNMENPLGKITKLRGVTYKINRAEMDRVYKPKDEASIMMGKKDKADEEKAAPASTPDVGLVAQEVEALFPEAVITDDKGYKAVAYTRLIPHLIESVKALKAENDSLRKDVAALKAFVGYKENGKK